MSFFRRSRVVVVSQSNRNYDIGLSLYFRCRERERAERLPDEVGAVAAECRLLEETGDERVFFDAVHVLLT